MNADHPNSPDLTRRKFIQLSAVGLAAGAVSPQLFASSETGKSNVEALASVGEKFCFAIFSDAHIAHENDRGRVPTNAVRNLKQAVAEVNAMDTRPAFVVHLGDMTHTPDDQSIAHWEKCVRPLQMPEVLVHGNHDGNPPYRSFLAMQKKRNGPDSPFYSFDCGAWHFVVIPCNLNGNDPGIQDFLQRMFAFLETDLEQNRNRPTIVLQHLHFLPVGLSQTEWYFFNLEIRKRLLKIYTQHGNVRWSFNGHVHNGIEASVKTSWSFRGINFINCPTIIEGRPFGEEYAGYETGLTQGGYYLVVEVENESVSLLGKLVGHSQGYAYPKTFQEFSESTEPKHFHTVGQLPAASTFRNGDFNEGLAGWSLPWRYMRDQKPVYSAEIRADDGLPGGKALALTTREAGVPFWSRDEYYEAAQICAIEPGKPVRVSAAYKLNQLPTVGGGYLRLELLQDEALAFLMLFNWGNFEDRSDYYPRCVGYAVTGRQTSWSYFQQLARNQSGFYWRLPMEVGRWHNLAVDVAELYNGAMADPEAFVKAKANKLRVAVGTWNDRQLDAVSEALFSKLAVNQPSLSTPSVLDGKPLGDRNTIAQIRFGMELEERVKREKKT
jgi:hypothetical protein